MTSYNGRTFSLWIKAKNKQPIQLSRFLLSSNKQENTLLGQFIRSNLYKEKLGPKEQRKFKIVSMLPQKKSWFFEVTPDLLNQENIQEKDYITIPCNKLQYSQISSSSSPPIIKNLESRATMKFHIYKEDSFIIITLPEFVIPLVDII